MYTSLSRSFPSAPGVLRALLGPSLSPAAGRALFPQGGERRDQDRAAGRRDQVKKLQYTVLKKKKNLLMIAFITKK